MASLFPPKSKETPSCIPEELLSGYLDGELTPEEHARVQKALIQEPELADDLVLLTKAGEAFSAEFSARTVHTQLGTWQAIEHLLPPKQTFRGGAHKDKTESPRKQVWQSRLNIFQWARNIRFGPAHAGIFALGLVVLGLSTSEWVELPTANVPVTGLSDQSALLNERDPIFVPLLPERAARGGNYVPTSNGGRATSSDRYSPQFISPLEIEEEIPMRAAGVKADGMHIEWVRDPKSVRIIRPSDGRASAGEVPPILWVGELR